MGRTILLFLKKYIKFFLFMSCLLYGVWLLFLLAKANLIFSGNEFLDSLLPSRVSQEQPEFLISFAASTLDSFIFFCLIGSISLLVSLKKPEEELFKKKLEYLFPSVNPDSKLHLYLRGEVGSLACVGTHSERTIIVQDLSECGRYAKTVLKTVNRIRNIHNNDLYANDRMLYMLKAEDVDFETTLLGEVLEVTVNVPTRRKTQLLYQLKTFKTLTKDSPEFKDTFRVHLEPHEEAVYKTVGWVWNELNKEKVNFTTSRFTESESFEIINNTQSRLKVTVITPPSNGVLWNELINKIRYRERMLMPSENMIVETKNRSPNDKISFLFSLQKE